jgi:hypothetical protein
MTADLSHVGMIRCFYCNEDYGIALDKRLRDVMPRSAVYNMQPCPQCEEFMHQGVILISVRDGEIEQEEKARQRHNTVQMRRPKRQQVPYKPDPYRTGGWIVVTEDYIRRVLPAPEQILQLRFAFVPDKDWDTVGFPRG